MGNRANDWISPHLPFFLSHCPHFCSFLLLRNLVLNYCAVVKFKWIISVALSSSFVHTPSFVHCKELARIKRAFNKLDERFMWCRCKGVVGLLHQKLACGYFHQTANKRLDSNWSRILITPCPTKRLGRQATITTKFLPVFDAEGKPSKILSNKCIHNALVMWSRMHL